ncbi:hypothetical protein IWQ57_005178 [Coemansia nantahalensis]|uniref:Uncharacterized protein n=1 Tax=Coemansia nantahalensis TaxID=2789366 RepID=A0ACC1JP20_9FUNG|nr:hypothetical protein IWQ57_005178 [Coemansia nantahalensis]
MPCTLFYFVYLVYVAVAKIADVGYISLILIGAIYGVQAIIFILRREWQHIGWMLIYLLAYPLWSFILPIYSFWHMDDFSWGNTRVVVGDGKRKLIIQDDKPFDPASIPQRRWREYEADLSAAGVLHAPPPNMNPNAGSSREDDRGTVISRFSGMIGSASRHGGTTPVPGMPRAATPTTVISGVGSVDPRLLLSTPVAQAHQAQQYQMVPGHGSVRPMSTVAGHTTPMADNAVPPRATSYYQYSTDPAGYFDGHFAPMTAGSPHATYSPGSPGYIGSPVAQPAAVTGTVSSGVYDAAMLTTPQMQPQRQRDSVLTIGMRSVAGAMPTNEQLVESIRAILNSHDLNNVTKKSVRAQLAAEYSVDLSSRKEFIGDAIEMILAGQL